MCILGHRNEPSCWHCWKDDRTETFTTTASFVEAMERASNTITNVFVTRVGPAHSYHTYESIGYSSYSYGRLNSRWMLSRMAISDEDDEKLLADLRTRLQGRIAPQIPARKAKDPMWEEIHEFLMRFSGTVVRYGQPDGYPLDPFNHSWTVYKDQEPLQWWSVGTTLYDEHAAKVYARRLQNVAENIAAHADEVSAMRARGGIHLPAAIPVWERLRED